MFDFSRAANWKITNVLCVLSMLAETCPRLTAITLTGWKVFSSDHLIYLAENFPALSRLDLSAISVSGSPLTAFVDAHLCLVLCVLDGIESQ